MDWKDLKPIIGGSAPLIGKLIGVGVSFIPGIGPIAGPIIGPAVGAILAKEFGVPNTPDAIAGAIQQNGGPESEIVKAKLAAATEQVKAQYAWAAAVETGEFKLEEVAVTQTNETMRAELGHEHWFFTGWRPAAGWGFDLFAGIYGLMLMGAIALAAFAGKPAALDTIKDAWIPVAAFLGVLAAMVGVYIVGRSQEKATAIQNSAPMPNAAPTPASAPPKVIPGKPPVLTIGKPAGARD